MLKLYSVRGNKTIWLSIVGFVILFFGGTSMYLLETLHFKNRLIHSFEMDILYDTFKDVVIVLTHIISMVLAVKVAKSLQRRSFFWGLLALIAPPVALIILGLMDRKIDNELIPIYNIHKLNYKNEIEKLNNRMNCKVLNKNDYDIEVNRITKTCDEKLNEEMLILTKKLEEKRMERVFNEISPPTTFVEVKDVCPACGANINDKMDTCPECGISFR